MKSTDSLSVSLFLLLVLAALTGCGDDGSRDQPETSAEDLGAMPTIARAPTRHIALKGQPNFRDIGGYQTTDGRTVKWRELFRTGELPELTDADVEVLTELELKTVVNFLLPQEIEKHGPDRLPEGVREIPAPIISERTAELSIEAGRAQRSGDFSQLSAEVNTQIHRILLEDAKEQYVTLLLTAANPENRPLAYHCSHGIHRTGTATAILLSALGVPWETIREDYLLSNEYRRDEAEAALARVRQLAAEAQGVPREDVDLTNAEAFYILDGSYIDGTLEQAIADYGSMENYVREGLGISDEDVAELRAQLLE